MCSEKHAIIRYETLKRRLAACQKLSRRLSGEMDALRREGQLHEPLYFGECPPPGLSPAGKVEKAARIGNGLYFVRARGEKFLAVHDSLAERYLTAMAAARGEWDADYWFYTPLSCAVPVSELSGCLPELARRVQSRESLWRTLHLYFPGYTGFYNDIYAGGSPIPNPDVAPLQFFGEWEV